MSIDVLIVGAGPVGMTLATELTRYGASVRIIDRASPDVKRPKGLTLWSRTLELLDRSGGADIFVAAGQKTTAGNIFTDGKRTSRMDFTAVDSPYPYLLLLRRGETERLLEERLNSFGVKVERNTGLVSVNHTGTELGRPTGVKAFVIGPDGSQEFIEAKWLVGCDGLESTVRKYLEMPVLGGSRQSEWVLADVYLTGTNFSGSEFAVFWHEKGVLAIFPLEDGSFRIIANLGKAVGMPRPDPTLNEIQALLDERVRHVHSGMVASNPIELSSFRVSDKTVRDYRMGRVFLAGDAAHVYSPIGAQGLNMGMQDAMNLSWKLALVIKGTCSEAALLPSYSVERSDVATQVTGTISRLAVASTMRNHSIQMVRNLLGGALLGLSPVRKVVANRMADVTLGYARSPLNGPEERAFPGPAPGDRMPPVPGQPPIGAGNAPRFVLFAALNAEIAELLQRHADLLEPDLRAPLSPRCIWLVRPDQYVAAVALEFDVQVIADYLNRLKDA